MLGPPVLPSFKLLVAVLGGFLIERQRSAVEFIRDGNHVLRQQVGKKRLRLTDDQQRRLAVKSQELGRKLLSEVATIVTPDTLLTLAAAAERASDPTRDSASEKGRSR